MKILLLDNYDSFTYNLVQYIVEITGLPVTVRRNDQIALDDVAAFDTIVLSPGPGLPADAGIMPALIQKYAATKRILGVCLGHQAIAEAFGGTLFNLEKVFHGVATDLRVTDANELVFKGLPERLPVGRYHSWAVVRETLPPEIEVTATDEAGTIMALRHRKFDVRGVQFHPESILTPDGKTMLRNYFNHH
ncbi:MAG: anthranilate synthase component II [Saprospiraceae bacterium]